MSNQTTPETKKVSTVLDKSSRALSAGQTAIGKVIAELQAGVETLITQQQSLAQDIEFKGRELAEVTANTDEALRNAKIELDFKVRENEDKVRTDLVRKAGLVTTTQTEIDESNSRVHTAEQRANQAEFEAVKRAEQALHSKYGAQISEIKSDQKVELATLNANAVRDADIIAGLRKQVESLETTIVAQREAETERTKALASNSVTVNNGK